MASEEQLRALTDLVLEAISYRRWCGGNDNPSLGKAILYVDRFLLPWARRELADGRDDQSRDAENLLSDAGFKAITHFHAFAGTTGGEFYRWVKEILAQLIAGVKRLREALRKGGLRHVHSLERECEAAKLAELLVSPELSPEEAGILRENAGRVRRAMRGLDRDERHVVKLRMAGRSLREIAATFGHAPSWAQAAWDTAAQHLRANLVRRHRPAAARATQCQPAF